MSKEIGVKFSRRLNTTLFEGNRLMTASRQAARGYQRRIDLDSTNKKAMRAVHGKMIRGGVGLGTGIYLAAKVAPWLGLAVSLIGILEINSVRKDWLAGFCRDDEQCY